MVLRSLLILDHHLEVDEKLVSLTFDGSFLLAEL